MKIMLYRITASLAICSSIISGPVYSESLDEYMSKHQSIDAAPMVSQYIRQWAWYMAMMDVQQKYGNSDSNKINELLNNHGDRYGALSIRKAAGDCRSGIAASGSVKLNKKECQIVINDGK